MKVPARLMLPSLHALDRFRAGLDLCSTPDASGRSVDRVHERRVEPAEGAVEELLAQRGRVVKVDIRPRNGLPGAGGEHPGDHRRDEARAARSVAARDPDHQVRDAVHYLAVRPFDDRRAAWMALALGDEPEPVGPLPHEVEVGGDPAVEADAEGIVSG